MAGLKLYWYFYSDIHRDCSKNLDLWLTRASYLFLDVAANQSFKGKQKVPYYTELWYIAVERNFSLTSQISKICHAYSDILVSKYLQILSINIK